MFIYLKKSENFLNQNLNQIWKYIFFAGTSTMLFDVSSNQSVNKYKNNKTLCLVITVSHNVNMSHSGFQLEFLSPVMA